MSACSSALASAMLGVREVLWQPVVLGSNSIGLHSLKRSMVLLSVRGSMQSQYCRSIK